MGHQGAEHAIPYVQSSVICPTHSTQLVEMRNNDFKFVREMVGSRFKEMPLSFVTNVLVRDVLERFFQKSNFALEQQIRTTEEC